MDEMINQDLIKKLRSDRCWSQEHLALVSGISLRTVQRVENEGKCSLDSKKALAAAFDLDVVHLCAEPAGTILTANDPKSQASMAWLASVDGGDYALSWRKAGMLFQNRITSDKWVTSLNQVRQPLGKVISRSIKNAVEHTSLPGVPDGQYCVITFITSFARKQTSLETVTLVESNNDWRVVGYFIK